MELHSKFQASFSRRSQLTNIESFYDSESLLQLSCILVLQNPGEALAKDQRIYLF